MTNVRGGAWSGPVDRRTVLRAAGLSAGAALVPGVVSAPAAAAAESEVFRHGVASGDPLPDGVLLWTRVTPTADAEPGSGLGPDVDVDWQLATDPDFAGIVAEGVFGTGPGRDHTVKVDVTGLAPATTYWYRFGLGGAWSPVGRTATAPAADADIDRLRAGVTSCANWEAGYFAAYRHLADRAARGDLDLMVHLGDYIYEYATGGFTATGVVIRPAHPAHEVVTLADYRARHALYKSDPDLRALHAAVPWVITWDDHEVANDMWAGGAENHTEGVEGAFADRLAAARRAYDEWMPVRLGADGRIWRRLRFGRLAELSMLDLRTYRSQQVWGPAADDPDRTITGAEQLAWLRDGLSGSDARWKLVGTSVMISRVLLTALPQWQLGPLREVLGQPQPPQQPSLERYPMDPDMWDGYPDDREELIGHLLATGTRDVVFLTGDVHTSWANQLTTRTGVGDPVAAEFVVPSVTTDNYDDFMRTSAFSKATADWIRRENPHVRWTELDQHGFGVLDVTAGRVRMDWYFVDDRSDPDSGARWAAAWSVGAGSAVLRPEPAPEDDPPAPVGGGAGSAPDRQLP